MNKVMITCPLFSLLFLFSACLLNCTLLVVLLFFNLNAAMSKEKTSIMRKKTQEQEGKIVKPVRRECNLVLPSFVTLIFITLINAVSKNKLFCLCNCI